MASLPNASHSGWPVANGPFTLPAFRLLELVPSIHVQGAVALDRTPPINARQRSSEHDVATNRLMADMRSAPLWEMCTLWRKGGGGRHVDRARHSVGQQ